MDDLEFRRRVSAQPNSTEKELLDFAEQHPERQAFIDDMQAFDTQLAEALDIPVPKGLAERILANTAAHAENEAPDSEPQFTAQTDANLQQPTDNVIEASSRFKLGRLPLAMAASLLVAVGAFFFSSEQNVAYAAGEHALAHVYYEINSLQKTEAISLETVNEKFAVLGGHLDELPGKVTYLMFCDFKGQKGLHLVFESEHGPMTVFIVPSKDQSFGIGADDFQDDRFEGHINRGPEADTILVASLGVPLEHYNDRINHAIRWLN
ncbi:DUF3379 family protein [Pseudoalteromonas haloplanktis]|uniref:DUF3379 family protein n=1 Tax=Pseudoalteromonas haloplanktis TaxID=228 RepID=A0ABU1BG43_PSEHA|nr:MULTISPECIES: DUF3379 family protein [Pseudoalteromonas]MDQ9092889.1 DUF3379 family protein [Pseudoalteromonas haloplanktis]TMN73597.1 DUF3379 domain-containing protein [Pseudoalteromonas sp. S1727]